MRPLSYQSASTFFPHFVAAPAALANESDATALRTSTSAKRNVRSERVVVTSEFSRGRTGDPAERSLPVRGEPVVWGE